MGRGDKKKYQVGSKGRRFKKKKLLFYEQRRWEIQGRRVQGQGMKY